MTINVERILADALAARSHAVEVADESLVKALFSRTRIERMKGANE